MGVKPKARVVLTLTPAQAKCVNSALALYESEEHDYDDEFNLAVLRRTRAVVWDGLDAARVEP